MPASTRLLLLAPLALAGACTTLGPVPTTTGVSPIPYHRPSVDVQTGALPGLHLSSTTREDGEGSGFPHYSAVFEPDRVLGVAGLIVGAGYVAEGGPQVAPYAGWRGHVDAAHEVAVAAVGFGAYASDRDSQATVDFTRIGAEATVDVNLTGASRIAELHVVANASLQGVWATGAYCVDAMGDGKQCDDSAEPTVEAELSDVLPAGRAGVAIDFARYRHSVFHGGRIELTFGGGVMPRLVSGAQTGRQGYANGGVTLTLGFGAKE